MLVAHPNFWSFARIVEFTLWTTGLMALGIVAVSWSGARLAQAGGAYELAELSGLPAPQAGSVVEEGTVLARIEIPRLKLSAVIFEGTTTGTLAKGVGHLRGTSNLGAQDNIVLAAHRDTFFKPLQEIIGGDSITITGPHRSERYQVTYTEVVTPNHVEVVSATGTPVLTLITCYPFSFLGAAPKRFIVRADRVWTSDF